MRSLILIIALIITAASPALSQPGSLDASFGTGGVQLIPMGAGKTASHRHGSVTQSDGKIVSLVDNPGNGATMVRINTDGSLDPTFGSGGVVYTDWHYASAPPYGQKFAIAIQEVNGEERFVVAGSWSVKQSKWSVRTMLRVDRYLPNGSIDTSFGSNGTVILNTGYALTVAVQPTDQKILTVGDAKILVRLNSNGSLDTTFGSAHNGTVNTGLKGHVVRPMPDGKILVGGQYLSGSTSLMSIGRYNADGTLDSTFGTGGWTRVNFFGNRSSAVAYDLAIDPYGNIVGAGSAKASGGSYKVAVMRLISNGILDPYFGGTGKVTYSFSGLTSYGQSLAVEPNGRVLVGGYAGGIGAGDFGVVRFNLDGSVDTSFGNSGQAVTNVDGSDYANSMELWTDPFCVCEKITLVGTGLNGPAFVRYNGQ